MVLIEKANITDLPNISEIENHSFSNPWSSEQLQGSLDNTYVAREDEIIKGFICIEIAMDEIHILHMAVHNKYRGQGIGKKMMEMALRLGGKKIFLEVRESNFQAIKLYESFGFKTISRRNKYYQDNDEDALIMELKKN